MSEINFAVILLNLIATFIIYSAPIIIYRYAVKKTSVEKKKAKKITIIYGIIAFFVMSVLITLINGSGAANGSILLWSWINYRVLIGGRSNNSSSSDGFTSSPSNIESVKASNRSNSYQSHPEINQVPLAPPTKKVLCKHCGGVVNTENNICTYCGNSYQEKRSYGRIIIISAVTLLLVALNIYQYYDYNTSLIEKNEYISSLEAEINDLNQSVKEWKITASRNKSAEKIFEAIEDFFSSGKALTYNKYSNYYASTNVVILEKGDNATFNVTSKTQGTVWMKANTGIYIDYEWSEKWNNNATSVTVAGKKTGTCILEFTKDNTADTFYVLVIII